jgi:hypothetical protein
MYTTGWGQWSVVNIISRMIKNQDVLVSITIEVHHDVRSRRHWWQSYLLAFNRKSITPGLKNKSSHTSWSVCMIIRYNHTRFTIILQLCNGAAIGTERFKRTFVIERKRPFVIDQHPWFHIVHLCVGVLKILTQYVEPTISIEVGHRYSRG